MTHLDICNTSYGKKKGRESKWQFDSQPQKVKNRPYFRACKWCATHRWKDLNESYNFASNRVPIKGLSKKLWPRKVAEVPTLAVPTLTKSHLDVGLAERCREYYMGEGGGFPRVWVVVSLVSPKSPVACLSTKGVAT
jgi:hypothetical protein